MSTQPAATVSSESWHDEEKQSPNDAKLAAQPVEYPPVIKRILIMIALYLSMFLITLVSFTINVRAPAVIHHLIGPKHHCDCDPTHH